MFMYYTNILVWEKRKSYWIITIAYSVYYLLFNKKQFYLAYFGSAAAAQVYYSHVIKPCYKFCKIFRLFYIA